MESFEESRGPNVFRSTSNNEASKNDLRIQKPPTPSVPELSLQDKYLTCVGQLRLLRRKLRTLQASQQYQESDQDPSGLANMIKETMRRLEEKQQETDTLERHCKEAGVYRSPYPSSGSDDPEMFSGVGIDDWQKEQFSTRSPREYMNSHKFATHDLNRNDITNATEPTTSVLIQRCSGDVFLRYPNNDHFRRKFQLIIQDHEGTINVDPILEPDKEDLSTREKVNQLIAQDEALQRRSGEEENRIGEGYESITTPTSREWEREGERNKPPFQKSNPHAIQYIKDADFGLKPNADCFQSMTLVDTGPDLSKMPRGNALQAAIWRGNENVVKLLLDAGADVNAPAGKYGNALQAAVWRGHENVVKLLLYAGADVNAPAGKYGNALQAASALGRERVVKLLLDHGANVQSQGEEETDSQIYMSAQLREREYTIGWLCSGPLELAAALEMFDEHHPDQHDRYGNTYYLGSIAGRNVTLMSLPTGDDDFLNEIVYQMKSNFKICFLLTVGVAQPYKKISVGDVVVNVPPEIPSNASRSDSSGPSSDLEDIPVLPTSLSTALLSVVTRIRAATIRGKSQLSDHIARLSNIPAFNVDNLQDHQVHYGKTATFEFAQSDLMKKTYRNTSEVLCGELVSFPSEAALIFDGHLLAIRGICDYRFVSQPCAAATAAAYTREVVSYLPLRKVISQA